MHGPTFAIIQARMTSTRLPGKVMKPLAGVPLLGRVLERVARIEGIDGICVACPDGEAHEPVADYASKLPGVTVTRGPEDDVLSRFKSAIEATGAETVVRITSDCPFIDPEASAAVIAAFRAGSWVYARTSFNSGFPHGFDTEVVRASVLIEAAGEATDADEREHVTPFVWRRPERYPAVYLDARPDRRHWRLVVDTQEDYALARAVYERLYAERPDFGYSDLIALFEAAPDLLAINGGNVNAEASPSSGSFPQPD